MAHLDFKGIDGNTEEHEFPWVLWVPFSDEWMSINIWPGTFMCQEKYIGDTSKK